MFLRSRHARPQWCWMSPCGDADHNNIAFTNKQVSANVSDGQRSAGSASWGTRHEDALRGAHQRCSAAGCSNSHNERRSSDPRRFCHAVVSMCMRGPIPLNLRPEHPMKLCRCHMDSMNWDWPPSGTESQCAFAARLRLLRRMDVSIALVHPI